MPATLRIVDLTNNSIIAEQNTTVQTYNLTFDKEKTGLNVGGNYALFFEGKGKIAISGAVVAGTEGVNNTPFSIQNTTGNRMRGDFILTNPEAALNVRILESDAIDYIKNIEIYKIQNTGNYSLNNTINLPAVSLDVNGKPIGSKYYDAFIDRMSEFPLLRFMNLFRINNSTISEVDAAVHRPSEYYTYTTLADAYKSDCPNENNINPCSTLLGLPEENCWNKFPALDQKGVPLQEVKDMHQAILNRTGKNVDVWFNIPHNASDDYVRGVGEFFANEFTNATNIYMEYSNEVWNTKFTQHNAVSALSLSSCTGAIDFQDCENGYLYNDYCIHKSRVEYANKAKQIFGLFQQGLNVASGNTKPIVKRVVAAQHGNPMVLAEIANFFLPGELDVLSVGGYVHPHIYSLRDANTGHTLLDGNGNPIIEGYGANLNINSTINDLDFWTRASMVDKWKPAIIQCKKIADCFGAELMLYEGGQHVLNSNLRVSAWPYGNDETHRVNPEVLLDYQSSNLMTELYRDWFGFLRNEAKVDGILAYSLTSEPNAEHGSWGHLNHIFEDPCSSNKFPVLMEHNENHNNSILYGGCLNSNFSSINNLDNFRIYVNHVFNYFILQVEKPQGLVYVLDMKGKTVLKQKINGKTTAVDIKTLKGGSYLVKYEKIDLVQKIIKY